MPSEKCRNVPGSALNKIDLKTPNFRVDIEFKRGGKYYSSSIVPILASDEECAREVAGNFAMDFIRKFDLPDDTTFEMNIIRMNHGEISRV